MREARTLMHLFSMKDWRRTNRKKDAKSPDLAVQGRLLGVRKYLEILAMGPTFLVLAEVGQDMSLALKFLE